VNAGQQDRPRTGRDRRHLFPGRQQRVHVRLTDDEYTDVATAADQAGLTPTGFCAQVALDAARNLHANTVERLEHQVLGDLQAELFQARVTVNRLRVELNRTLDSGYPAPIHLDETIVGAARSLAELDGVISCIDRQLAQRKTPGSGMASQQARSTESVGGE
jgi:uncharacterized protein (DUF1778 family)